MWDASWAIGSGAGCSTNAQVGAAAPGAAEIAKTGHGPFAMPKYWGRIHSPEIFGVDRYQGDPYASRRAP